MRIGVSGFSARVLEVRGTVEQRTTRVLSDIRKPTPPDSEDGGTPDTGKPLIWTIGHSSRPIGEFLDLLEAQEIELLADVRRYPGSRAHPHFNPEPLARALAERRMEYLPLPELGGRRTPDPESTNTVWRNAAFRAYADFMQTPGFDAAVSRLTHVASGQRTAIMCSEAVWWRCHRALIADHLKAAGFCVLHIMGRANVTEHPYTSAARIVDGKLSYSPGSA